MHPTTPDGRYFVVKGQLWRCTNPSLTEQERQRLVHDLMDARRAVKRAKRFGDSSMLKSARSRVDAAKVELGERGPVWWHDGSPDYNRCWVSFAADSSIHADWDGCFSNSLELKLHVVLGLPFSPELPAVLGKKYVR